MVALDSTSSENKETNFLAEFVTARELAEYIGMPYPNLWTYQKRGVLPSPDMYVGNKPLWRKHTIEAWIFPEFKKRVKHVEEE